VTLLPLREKVSAQPTDEGSRRRLASGIDDLAEGPSDPSSDPLSRATFSRKGRRAPHAIDNPTP